MNTLSLLKRFWAAALQGQPNRVLASPQLLSIVLGVLLCSVFFRPVFQVLDWLEMIHFTNRQMAVLSDRSESEITVVGLDTQTLRDPFIRKYFGRMPLGRDVYSYFVDFLNRSRSRMVIFDFAFDNPADPLRLYREAQFMASIERSKIPVVSSLMLDFAQRADSAPTKELMPYTHSLEVKSSGEKETQTILRKYQGRVSQKIQGFSAPFQGLMDTNMKFAMTRGVWVDGTGVIRGVIPFFLVSGSVPSTSQLKTSNPSRVFPYLALAPLLFGYGMGFDPDLEVSYLKTKDMVWFNPNQTPIIRWYGDMRYSKEELRNLQSGLKRYEDDPVEVIYPKYSFANVIKSEMVYRCQMQDRLPYCEDLKKEIKKGFRPLSPSLFYKQYVLMGLTDAEIMSSDTHQTLYGRGANYPGVFVVANIMDNFLNNGFVNLAPPQTLLGSILFMVLVVAYGALRIKSVLLELVVILATFFGFSVFTAWMYEVHNQWVNWVYPVTVLMALYVISFSFRYVMSERKKQQIRFTFARYVSPHILKYLETHFRTHEHQGQRQELTILFCDIRGFTSFAEQNPPEYVQSVLTRYFSMMNGIVIHQHHGTLSKIMGDSLMAFWGFPYREENHALQAVRAALEMKAAIESWRAEGNPPFQVGIGIATGDVMIGNVGSEDFMDFTVIGDVVNTAARLESLNKELGNPILIAEETYEAIRDVVECQFLGTHRIRGKQNPIPVYEPLSQKITIQESSLFGEKRGA